MGFTHVMVGAEDVDASKRFYDAVFKVIGIAEGHRDDQSRVFWRVDGIGFGIGKPRDGREATPANGGTIGFACESPAQVREFHAAGLANGGVTAEDPPGRRLWAKGQPYTAYLRDPSGNKICAICRGPRAAQE